MSKKGHYSGGHSVVQGGRFVASRDPAEPNNKRKKPKKRAIAHFSRLAQAKANEAVLDTKHGKKK